MYVRDYPRKYGANNAIESGERVESPHRRCRGRFRNEVSRSDRLRGVGVTETSEWPRPFSAVFVGAMRGSLCHENSQFMTHSHQNSKNR